ncbi:flagellar basal body rod protein FlgB [Terribacillus saccharophilus]|uniref:Flagellar basal body rod protein FlgB n=1 Tax=Terribacillus saccharophilus TaxID=361277 RepID=A0A268AAD7_9BACI|nr:flagellar basal body rod protein FlgB [Terribacillus saccharophilus]PAD21095.1 flagellar basal body rod protein FlgB [Terribacillus saccharophilus]PAF22176.1 flagellar basal body rod protein FlgB [Terribacillus saccharophilus]PAF38369.1 flagellar basal body rod protein FlgB [Terribacillus saccharophilus]PAF40126.1 flagellar basal body rod protein FlgB [Terribacillus saccharophilus]
MDLYGKTIQALDRSLDYANLKNQTIANNIANADTPGYKTETVSFKDTLQETMEAGFTSKRTNPKHLIFGSSEASSEFQVSKQEDTSYTNSENNVDIDKEMSELADNQLYYQALVDRMSGKFNSLSKVITGGN